MYVCIIIIIIIIIKEQLQQAPLKGTITLEGQEKRKEEVGVKRKWWVLSQPPNPPQINGRQLPRVGTVFIR